MTTALDIITKAMLKAGILTKTESPSADEASDALDALNDLLASWSNDSLLITNRVTELFTLSAGVGNYTIGAGQAFDTIRPIKIVESHIIDGIISYESMYQCPDEIYQGFNLKTLQSIPSALNYSNAYPYGTIKLYPYPSTGYTLSITSEKELSQFTLNQTVNLAPGWNRALIYNLAVELAPEYGQPIEQMTLKTANDSKGAISRSIMKVRTMDAPPLSQIGRFNIYTGYWT
jgi:hypothetical protein